MNVDPDYRAHFGDYCIEHCFCLVIFKILIDFWYLAFYVLLSLYPRFLNIDYSSPIHDSFLWFWRHESVKYCQCGRDKIKLKMQERRYITFALQQKRDLEAENQKLFRLIHIRSRINSETSDHSTFLWQSMLLKASTIKVLSVNSTLRKTCFLVLFFSNSPLSIFFTL